MAIISETHPQEDNLIQTISLIGISIIIVFYTDIITPLGFMTWILYFIPLFLTLYIRWQYGPYLVSLAAIVLIIISYFLSPRDMSVTFALMNRVFFSLMLLISAFLIWRYKKRELLLEVSEERFQHMVEASPEIIVIIKDGMIQYINPIGLELCESRTGGDCMIFFEHEDHKEISSAIEKVTHGAKIELSDIKIRCTTEIRHLADVWIGEIIWDGTPAIEMIIRIKIS